jgi:hypothetical protein
MIGWGFLIGLIAMFMVNVYERSQDRKHREEEWERICQALGELGWDSDALVNKLSEIAKRTN